MKNILLGFLAVIALTTSIAQANSALICANILLENTSAPSLTSNLAAPRNSHATEQLTKRTENIETAGELIKFLDAIDSVYAKSIHQTWGPTLQNINLAKVLERIQQRSPHDPHLKELENKLALYNREAKLGGWTFPLLLMLQPSKVMTFLNGIKKHSNTENGSFQLLAEGIHEFSFVNPSLHYVLSRLPQHLKNQALQKIQNEMAKIDLENEQLKMENGVFHQPVSRNYRRNLEVVLRMITSAEIKILEKDLRRNQISSTEALDKYFVEIYKVVGPKRGGYSSRTVFTAAKIVQKHFSGFLTDKNKYIDLYGSFVNGKAAFNTSDIDMKISESLFYELFKHSYRAVKGDNFQLFFADFIKEQRGNISPELKEFWEAYKSAETNLAKEVFQRQPKHESELLAMLYPPVPFKDEPGDSRWYNSLTIRIYADKIELHISDLMSPSHPKYEKEIKDP